MRFLRHANGNGRIDSTSEADEFSVIDRFSVLEDKSSVWSSALKRTNVRRSTITGAVISDSVISRSLITGGQIENSTICAELIADYALIKNSTVAEKCRVAHTAHLENVSIENLTVGGAARLINWDGHFDGQGGYITRGIWERPPQILYLEKDLTITEGVPGHAFCGCMAFEISHWLKVGSRYGKKLGLSPDDVQRIREFLLTL